ncbi:hypothetical protein MPSEU_000566900 [Mayamaea pseudoterrestris]|nr:hypothetical protein MPSEU_000566900 [Mayamaea pseudoterrestris]
MVRTSKQAKVEPVEWENPIWEYVRDDEEEVKRKRSWGIGRRTKERHDDPSLLGFLSFDNRNTNSSSRQASSNRMMNMHPIAALFDREEGETTTVSLLDAETLTNVNSAWSFLDQPYEISERDWKKQLNKEHCQDSKTLTKVKEQRAAVKNSSKGRKPLKYKDAEDDSWFDLLLSFEGSAPKTNKLNLTNKPRISEWTSNKDSSGTYYDNQPYEISARGFWWQKKREKTQIQRDLNQGKKAHKTAKKAEKTGIQSTSCEHDDDYWLAMFSSGDEGDFERKIPTSPWTKSKKPSSSCQNEKETGQWVKNSEQMSRDTPAKLWDGITATFEPWLVGNEYDNYDSGTSSCSDVSTDTGRSSLKDDDSQAESANSFSDDPGNGNDITIAFDRDENDFQSRYRANTTLLSPLKPILKSSFKEDPLKKSMPTINHDSDLYLGGTNMINREDSVISTVLPKITPAISQDQSIPVCRQTIITPVGKVHEQIDHWGAPISAGPESSNDQDFQSYALALNSAPRVVCCSIKDLDLEQLRLARETGLPIHELSPEELATIFPKLRSVANERSHAHPRSVVIGNSLSFERELPAHFQAVLKREGPQSLYEYEYESGVQKLLLYDSFGNNPRELLKMHVAGGLPEDGLNDVVLVQVEASTVSPTDCAIRRGDTLHKSHVPLPNSPGVDAVGVIYRVDAHTRNKFNLLKGQRVITLSRWGGNSRYLSVKPDDLVKVPDDIDPAEATCLPETYLSVFQILHHGQSASLRYRNNALKGKCFLVVGNMQANFGRAIGQLAAIGGAENVYATAKTKHVQKLVSFGILPVSNDPIEFCARLENRIDIIISLEEPLTPLHHKALRTTGVVITMAQTERKTVSASHLDEKLALFNCSRNKKVAGLAGYCYDVFIEWDRHLKRCKADLRYLIQKLQESKISPYILDRIPLAKVPKAQEMIEAKKLPGFIVCEPWLISKSRAVAL